MIDDLIYDVGMYDGADTAYYLRLGFRVVAVEADPALCDAARARFSSDIAAGRLTIVHRAIVSEPGPTGSIVLWVNPVNREWNSLVEQNAARREDACVAVEVPAVRFETLLLEYGVPWGLKVDIEGLDGLCAAAIDPENRPRYVSFEFSDERVGNGGGDLIDVLEAKGYRRFKCIRQTDLVGLREGMVPEREPSPLVRWLRQRPGRLAQKWVRLTQGKEASRAKLRGRLPDGSAWLFSGSSSGGIGEFADGPWLSSDMLRKVWRPWGDARKTSGENWRYWFDLHATE